MFWSNFGEWLGGTVTLGVIASGIAMALGLVAKNFVGHFYDKHLEGVKADYRKELERMRQEHQESLEGYRSELALLREKSVIQYSRLHEDQATHIKALYEQAVLASSATYDYLEQIRMGANPADPSEETQSLKRAFRLAIGELLKTFTVHRIYFDDDLDELVKEVINTTQSSVRNFEGLATRRMRKDMTALLHAVSASLVSEQVEPETEDVDMDVELSDIYDRLGALLEQLVAYFRHTLGSVPSKGSTKHPHELLKTHH